MSTGRFRSSGVIRKCSSIARNPASISRKSSGPMAIISDRPIAESIEYRPPTQSQNPNMFAVSMPNSATCLGVRAHGDEVAGDGGLVAAELAPAASRGRSGRWSASRAS